MRISFITLLWLATYGGDIEARRALSNYWNLSKYREAGQEIRILFIGNQYETGIFFR